MHWNDEHFGRDKDVFARPAITTFRNIDHYRVAHGIGEIREATSVFEATLKTLTASMDASFVALPDSEHAEGRYTLYLAFVQCGDDELLREVYDVGTTGILSFEEPYPNCEPNGWKYTIKPPIPEYEYPGNLVFLIRRRKDDNREIPDDHVPKLKMRTIKIWASPKISDLTPRRLVDCANLLKSRQQDGANTVRRYILGNDLSPSGSHGLFTDDEIANLSSEDQKFVRNLRSEFSQSQAEAFEFMRKSKHPLVFVHGPFGSGKTTWILKLGQIAWKLGYKNLGLSDSNAGVEVMASGMEKVCPQMGAIRAYSTNTEIRDLRREEQRQISELSPDEVPKHVANPELESVPPITDEMQETQAWSKFMIDLRKNPQAWNPTARIYANKKSTSLSVRALQNAGLLRHNVPAFTFGFGDPHAAFRDSLEHKDFANEETAKEAKRLEIELMYDTTRKGGCLFTTLSNSADGMLLEALKPQVVSKFLKRILSLFECRGWAASALS